MSYTEVMLLCSYEEEVEHIPIEKYLPMVIHRDRYPIIDTLNAWILERHGPPRFTQWDFTLTQQAFEKLLAPDLAGKISKELMFFGAWNSFDSKAFLDFLRSLPWKAPRDVHVLFGSYDNPLYSGDRLFSETVRIKNTDDNSLDRTPS